MLVTDQLVSEVITIQLIYRNIGKLTKGPTNFPVLLKYSSNSLARAIALSAINSVAKFNYRIHTHQQTLTPYPLVTHLNPS